MPSGGARARAGPPPDPNALRRDRNTDAEWLTLPAGGRGGRAPKWPLAGQSAREKVLWRDHWTTPQAVAWEKFGLHYDVALMIRRLAEAEEPESHTSTSTLVRQMRDALGLTVPGMRANRWKLSDDEVAEQRAERPAGGGAAEGRARLRALSE